MLEYEGAAGPAEITVRVAVTPNSFLLRRAIADRIAGRPFPPGPETEVAEAVAAHVARVTGESAGCR